MKQAAKKAKEKPGDIAQDHLETLGIGKQGYKAADSALDYLLSLCRDEDCPTCGAPRFKNGGVVKSSDGRSFRIVDKYAKKNSVPVGQNARRYEIEEIRP